MYSLYTVLNFPWQWYGVSIEAVLVIRCCRVQLNFMPIHTKALFIYALKVGPFLEESGFDFDYL